MLRDETLQSNPGSVQTPLKIRRLPIAAIAVGSRIREDMGDLATLAELLKSGQLQPIGVAPIEPGDYGAGFRLVFGQRRLEALKINGETEVNALVFDQFTDALAAMRAELNENEGRKDFTPTELAKAARLLKELAEPDAHARRAAGLAQNADVSRCGSATTTGEQRRTRDEIAAALGKSPRTIERAVEVVEAAEAEPERYGDLPAKMDATSINAAHKELRARQEPEPIAQPDGASGGAFFEVKDDIDADAGQLAYVARIAKQLDEAIRGLRLRRTGPLWNQIKANGAPLFEERQIEERDATSTRRRTVRVCVAGPRDLADAIRRVTPKAVCAGCRGARCVACGHLGFIPSDESLIHPDQQQEIETPDGAELMTPLAPWEAEGGAA